MISKRWLVIATITFIVVCAWVFFDIIHTRAQVEIPPKTKDVIEPIDPNFNIKVLESTP